MKTKKIATCPTKRKKLLSWFSTKPQVSFILGIGKFFQKLSHNRDLPAAMETRIDITKSEDYYKVNIIDRSNPFNQLNK